MMDHRDMAEQMLSWIDPYTASSVEAALAHAVLALVDKLDEVSLSEVEYENE